MVYMRAEDEDLSKRMPYLSAFHSPNCPHPIVFQHKAVWNAFDDQYRARRIFFRCLGRKPLNYLISQIGDHLVPLAHIRFRTNLSRLFVSRGPFYTKRSTPVIDKLT